MLIINAKIGNKICVGSGSLTIKGIDTKKRTVTYTVEHKGEKTTKDLASGVMTVLIPGVGLLITDILDLQEPLACLGFDAPRSIKIHGDWYRASRGEKEWRRK